MSTQLVCGHRSECAFYNTTALDTAEKTLKTVFCTPLGYEKCEIHRLLSVGKQVKDNMLPNGSAVV